MANGALDDEVKEFIVRGLACFDTPTKVAAAVKQEFDIEVSRQAVHTYNPTRKAGEALSEKLKILFEQTRAKFLSDIDGIPVASKAARLRMLDRMARKAEDAGSIVVAAALLEQAAKEVGGAFDRKAAAPEQGGEQPAAVGADHLADIGKRFGKLRAVEGGKGK